MKKRLISLLLVVLMATAALAGGVSAMSAFDFNGMFGNSLAAKTIKVGEQTVVLSSGTSYINSASSSNPGVASFWLDSSTHILYVRGESIGSAVITVYYNNGGSATMQVTVSNTTAGTGTGNQTTIMAVNAMDTLANLRALSCTSSNPNVVAVNLNTATGVVTMRAVSIGTATIYYSGYVGTSTTLSSRQLDVVVTATGAAGAAGGTLTLVPGASDTSTSLHFTSAISANAAIANCGVSGGTLQVIGVTAGTTQIHYSGTNRTTGALESGILTVVVSASGNTATAISLAVGESKIQGITNLYNATSMNPSIATVTMGSGYVTVRGVSPGTAQLMYYISTAPTTPLYTTITVTSTGAQAGAVSVAVGATTNQVINNLYTCQSMDQSVASVSKNGTILTVKGVKAGSTQIMYSVATAPSTWLYLPVTVTSTGSGTNTNAGRISLGNKTNYNIAKGKKVVISGVRLDGTVLSSSSGYSGLSKLLWVSSNTNVATVASTGVITTKGSGTCNIIAVTPEGDSVAKVTVTVN